MNLYYKAGQFVTMDALPKCLISANYRTLLKEVKQIFLEKPFHSK
jgi:hypothetical protein